MNKSSPIRIALICNMNNMFSAICKYLIDGGYDAYLFQYNDHPAHFDGRADSFGTILEGRILGIDWTDPAHLIDYPVKLIQEQLKGFDYIIACGTSPAFLSKAGITLDLLIPYGSDIYLLPFFQFSRNPVYLYKRLYFQFFQRRGIRNAKSFIMERQLDWVEKRVSSLKMKSHRVFTSIPMVHLPTYENVTSEEVAKLKYYKIYKEIRNNHDLVIFHHSRHSWKNPHDKFELKGNDILFRGFAEFLKINTYSKACIVTLEYGDEVADSKDLICSLGIDNNVFWLPKQDRKELMMGLSLSDLVVGELFNSFNLYGITAEALQMGKPIMQKRIDSEFSNDYPSLHPIIYADSVDSVCEGILKYVENPAKYKDIGLQGRKWYQEHILRKFLGTVQSLIASKMNTTL